jgi:DNA end-binding protein Ku
MRSLWTGALTFGLVTMPVKLYSAASSKTVSFKQLHAGDNVRIQTQRYCPAHEEEVAFEDIVRGYEIAPDRYVVVEDAELEALAPEATRTIEIEDFANLNEIDPIYFDQPYYVVPNAGGANSYRLLLEAMRDTGKIAIARVVLRSRERLVVVRPYGDALLMATMMFGDEVHPYNELSELDKTIEVGKRELEVARQLVSSLAGPFDLSKYRDTYREAVLDLIDRKANGEDIVTQPPKSDEPRKAPDLMSALEASLVEVRKRAASANGKPRGRAGARRRAVASESTAKADDTVKGQRRGTATKSRRGDRH